MHGDNSTVLYQRGSSRITLPCRTFIEEPGVLDVAALHDNRGYTNDRRMTTRSTLADGHGNQGQPSTRTVVTLRCADGEERVLRLLAERPQDHKILRRMP